MKNRGNSQWPVIAIVTSMSGCAAPIAELPPLVAAKAGPVSQRVYVTIDADTRDLALVETDQARDIRICFAPCNQTIDVRVGAQYRIIGSRMMPTRTFELYSPHDPIVWLDVEATKRSTNTAFRSIFLTTIIAGGVLTLTGFIATPIVKDETVRTGVSAVGLAGLVLALPVGSVLGLVSSSYSQSNVRFRDPTTRSDLQKMIQ
jgi:hypothetical protein